MSKFRSFLVDEKKELKKVKWPNKKDMTIYSVATISFIIFNFSIGVFSCGF